MGFDIEEFRVTPTVALASGRPKQHKRRRGAQFIPGPIPIALLRRYRAPIAFRVWLLLHTRRRMHYSPRLSRSFLASFGLCKRDAQRGLAILERDGLVRVERKRGKAAVVELLSVPGDDVNLAQCGGDE